MLAAVVTYFGVLVCVYQAIQNLSKSERQQTRENLCWSGVLSGRSGLLPAHSMTPKETCIRRKSEIKVLFRHEGLSALSEDGYDLFQVSCAYFQGFSLALRFKMHLAQRSVKIAASPSLGEVSVPRQGLLSTRPCTHSKAFAAKAVLSGPSP